MSLDRVIDLLAARLSTSLAGVRVSDVEPASPADLPCAVLSLESVAQALTGIGGLPRGTRSGALRLSVVVDLATPVLHLEDGEELQLLSADRRTLTLPHGPVVRADGTGDPPFAAEDVAVDDGDGPFTVVADSPHGRQVRADPAGVLEFGVPLPETGRLTVGYHVGQWDTAVTRVQGRLTVLVTAASPEAVSDASRNAARALEAAAPGTRLTPVSWGSVRPSPVGGEQARSQALGFRLDAELEDPVLTTSGGVITRVSVTGQLTDPAHPDADPQPFEPIDVTQGAPA